jgi:hypothetical protein
MEQSQLSLGQTPQGFQKRYQRYTKTHRLFLYQDQVLQHRQNEQKPEHHHF